MNKKFIIPLGIVALILIVWGISQTDTVDYIASVDEEVTALENELVELEAQITSEELVGEEAVEVRSRISARLDAIQKNIEEAEKNRTLTPEQRASLTASLERLKNALQRFRDTLLTVDEAATTEERRRSVGNRITSKSLVEQAVATYESVEDAVQEFVEEYVPDEEIEEFFEELLEDATTTIDEIMEDEPVMEEETPSDTEPVTEDEPIEEEPAEDDLPITLEQCHIPFEIGTYNMVTVDTAVEFVLPILESRDSNIMGSDLEATTMSDGTVRVNVSRDYINRVGESQYCTTWEENDSCIGQWIDFENGKIMMEAQNPC